MHDYGGLDAKFSSFSSSKVVILPVPYDKTSTWGKGADKGPDAMLEASCNMELYDIETDSEAYKQGIFTDDPITEDKSPEAMVAAVKKRVHELIEQKKKVVVIGGEHSVTAGSVFAHNEKFNELSVLQIDAHTDLRDTFEGSRFNHACVMARVKEACPIVQVGIRSMDSSEKKNLDKKRAFFAQDIADNEKWFDRAIALLTKNVYVTIDLDGFDPAYVPATGTPEPGGLGWWQTLRFLRKVATQRNIVGFDVVELCPNPESKASDFLAAKLIYKLLSYIFYG